MDENRPAGGKGISFSEISELPPLKEIYVDPAPPVEMELPQASDAVTAAVFRNAAPEKPKTPPREVAKKAVSEIKKTPPQLFIYSIAGAAAVILLAIGGIWYHIHSGDSDDDSTPTPVASEVTTPAAVPSNANPVAAAPACPARQVVPEALRWKRRRRLRLRRRLIPRPATRRRERRWRRLRRLLLGS